MWTRNRIGTWPACAGFDAATTVPWKSVRSCFPGRSARVPPGPPAILTERIEGGRFGGFLAGLLLGAGSYHDETLLTPAFYAEAESSFILVQKQRKQPIELVHAVEITPCFGQFRFAPLY